MFTGLVAELGKVTAIDRGESSAVFSIAAPTLSPSISLGDSISVNGVCLTAIAVEGDTFQADVMVQTLSLTSLSQLEVGTPVNLELAATLNAHMGGHIVQGHVDGVATVKSLTPGEKWAEFIVEVPSHLMKYIVAQGSICIDGVSLTVGALNDQEFTVTTWLIPETLERTNLSQMKSGSKVNIEVDILAKYVERLLEKRGQ